MRSVRIGEDLLYLPFCLVDRSSNLVATTFSALRYHHLYSLGHGIHSCLRFEPADCFKSLVAGLMSLEHLGQDLQFLSWARKI